MMPPLRQFVPWIIAAALLLLYFFFDAREGGFPPCPFFKLTDLYCPGCGSQRGVSALLHGNLWQAMRFNVLLVAALPLLLYALLVHINTSGRQRPKLLYHPLFPRIVFVVVVLFWIFRNIPVYPFSILAPIAHAHLN